MKNIIEGFYNLDCENYIKNIKNNSIDLVICDPPYFRILKEDWDRFKNIDEYISWSERYLKLCIDKLRFSGTLILYGCTRNFNVLCKLNEILLNNGMYFVQEIIIDKGIKSVAGRTSTNIKMLPPVTENILVYRKDAKPFIKDLLLQRQKDLNLSVNEIKTHMGFALNGGGNWTKYCGNTSFPLLPTKEHWDKLKDILNINLNYNCIKETYNPILGLTNVWSDLNFNIRNRIHPCQKPLELSNRIITLFSCENDKVLIPFAGSGTDIISCINLNRKYYSCELDVNYFNLTKHRIENINNLIK